MKKQYWRKGLFWLGLWLLGSCIDPYTLPPSAQDAEGFLVVDGALNVADGSGFVRLTRTQNLADPEKPFSDVYAQVSVEDNGGAVYSLANQGDGTYRLSEVPLNYQTQYRLRIRTAGQKEYLSEFITPKRTPQIDSLSWSVEGNEIVMEVNTHDPENNTWYYRWEFEETWYYTSIVFSGLIYRNGQLWPREESVYECYRTQNPVSILAGTSTQLTQDRISRFPVARFPGASERFRHKYSYRVRQYAISREEFEYWQMLKKNTENVGTLFDPQPSQVTGNLTCLTVPDEPVMGYFSAGSVTEKRRFIRTAELVPYKFYWPRRECFIDTIRVDQLHMYAESVAYVEELRGPGGVGGYIITSPSCADCRLLGGGTTVKPDFWE